jgi:DNA polymerase-4
MASDFQKPDKTHTLYPDEIAAKMWPLPIGSLYGCGKQTAQRLKLIGVGTIGDAASMDASILQSVLGQKSGYYIWKSANGISTSPVTPEREQAKSVSNERTLTDDIDRENYQSEGIAMIRALSQKVAGRLQKAGLVGQTVVFQVKSNEFNRYSRQMSLPAATDSGHQIERAALDLADKLLNGPEGLFEEGIAIRLIGVGVSRLTAQQMHQMDLFEWADRNEEEQKTKAAQTRKQAKLDSMMEKINGKYGNGTIRKGEE